MLRIVAFLALLALLLSTTPAHAGEPTVCTKNSRTKGQKCHVSASVTTLKEMPGKARQKPSKQTACTDTLLKKTVPCERDGGWWYHDKRCYASVKQPQPDKSDPIWQGRTDGVIVTCLPTYIDPVVRYDLWLPDARPAPSPRVLAEEAVASMSLLPIQIGSYPSSLADNPDALGLVGRWVWLWAKEPDERTWGPVTKTVSAAGHSVTATARVSHVVWDMGDGKTRTCWGPGTPWRRGNPEVDPKSPTCSYRYQKQGVRTITATSHWRVDWSGIGQRGTIHFSLDASAQIAIGELQVVNVNKPRR